MELLKFPFFFSSNWGAICGGMSVDLGLHPIFYSIRVSSV
jgi:hypothetical protein